MSQEQKKISQPIFQSSASTLREIHNRYSKVAFTNQENNRLHNPYEDEQRRLDAISHGDLETVETFWTYNYGESYGQVATNHLRNIKNLCIGNIILASRAAIQGGASPESVFSYVDAYIQTLEECTDAGPVVELAHSADLHFTQMVIDAAASHSDGSVFVSMHIEDCKNYIFAHLHGKISIQDIASALHLNANYLSTIFKKKEGITIQQYIIRKKIEIAKNMLTFSQYSYSDIANFLGFSSQSHMGTHFKKETGMTMHEYRTAYMDPFFTDSDST